MHYLITNGTIAIAFLFERRGGILPWNVVFLAPPSFEYLWAITRKTTFLKIADFPGAWKVCLDVNL